MLVSSVIAGKFGALFASIPFPIFAALYCVLFGLVGKDGIHFDRIVPVMLFSYFFNLFLRDFFPLAASVGISFLQFTNMNSMRNLIITGLSLFLGISVPQYFNDTFSTSGHGPVNTRAGWVSSYIRFLEKILILLELLLKKFFAAK